MFVVGVVVVVSVTILVEATEKHSPRVAALSDGRAGGSGAGAAGRGVGVGGC